MRASASGISPAFLSGIKRNSKHMSKGILVFFMWLNIFLIEVKSAQFNHFKVYNPLAFSTYTIAQPSSLGPYIFPSPQKETPYALSNLFLALGEHQSAFCLYGFTLIISFIGRETCLVTFFYLVF